MTDSITAMQAAECIDILRRLESWSSTLFAQAVHDIRAAVRESQERGTSGRDRVSYAQSCEIEKWERTAIEILGLSPQLARQAADISFLDTRQRMALHILRQYAADLDKSSEKLYGKKRKGAA